MDDSRKLHKIILFATITLELLSIYLFLTLKTLYGIFLLLIPLAFWISIKSIEKPKLILFAVIAILSSLPVHSTMFFIKFPYKLLLLIFLISVALPVILYPEEIKRAQFGKYTEDKLFIIFMVYMFFSVLFSFGYGHKTGDTFKFTSIQIFYLGYFLGRVYLRYPEDWRTFKYILLLSTFIAFYELSYQTPYLKFLKIGRLLFLQTYTMFIAFVIALNEIAFGVKNKMLLFFYHAVIIIDIAGIVISLNRTMWIMFVLAAIWLFILWIYLVKISLKPILTGALLWFSGIIVAFVVSAIKFGPGFLLSLAKRINTFSNLSHDSSLKIRAGDIVLVWHMLWKSPIWGYGIGDMIWRRWKHIPTFYIDNDYMVLLWHYGFIGTILFLSFWISAIMVTFKGAREIKDREKRVLLLSTFTVGSLLLINAHTETIFTTRPHVAVFTAMLGMAVSLVRSHLNAKGQ